MKAAVFSVILIITSTFADLSPGEADEAWKKYLVGFLLSFGRSNCVTVCKIYWRIIFAQDDFNIRASRSDNIDELKRNFVARANLVNNINAENSTYELEINSFSHLSLETLQKTKTGVVPDPEIPGINETQQAGEEERSGRATAPANFDWRTIFGVVRAVQDQKSCGSCWAFAAIGAIEGQMGIYKRKYDKLSEQEIIECAKSADGSLRGCNGGWSSLVYKHSRDNQGVTTSTYKPYLATTSKKVCNVYNLRAPSAIVASWNFAPAKDEVTIKNWVYNYGPLYVFA